MFLHTFLLFFFFFSRKFIIILPPKKLSELFMASAGMTMQDAFYITSREENTEGDSFLLVVESLVMMKGCG